MKKHLAVFTLILAFCHIQVKSQEIQPSLLTIDQFDTVFFDLSAATVVGNTVEFPVYYRSDDQVVALDFNFKYNHNKLDYDTIVKTANYLDVLSFYNANDSTVRLTSYTNTLFYPNDSILFKVKFTVLQPGPLCNGDIYAVNSLLNGDVCTSGIIDCTSGLNETEWFNKVTLFPNPACSFVEVSGLPNGSSYQLYDAVGGKVHPLSEIKNSSGGSILDMSGLPSGVYNLVLRKGNDTGRLPIIKVD